MIWKRHTGVFGEAPSSEAASRGSIVRFSSSTSVSVPIGVISPSGNEVGPFLPIEQAALESVIARVAAAEVNGVPVSQVIVRVVQAQVTAQVALAIAAAAADVPIASAIAALSPILR